MLVGIPANPTGKSREWGDCLAFLRTPWYKTNCTPLPVENEL